MGSFFCIAILANKYKHRFKQNFNHFRLLKNISGKKKKEQATTKEVSEEKKNKREQSHQSEHWLLTQQENSVCMGKGDIFKMGKLTKK